jgi:hypothetical protein
MKRISILFVIMLLTSQLFAQIGKKVQFVGGARSLLSHSDFHSADDTVTAPKRTGGYALLDLGFKINPNEATEILGMVRIRNDFGGFWGGGVSFDVRQLYVRGVVADIVRYQIGNIDYKLTPYTFYNHNPDMLVANTGTMGIKEGVVNYESFYKNHTWRQQGASVNFALQFPKVIQEIEFNGFITRLNPSSTNVLERLFGGGNVVFKQSKYVDLGVNYVSIFDLKGTALDSNVYANNVTSFTYDLHLPKEKFVVGIDGESGFSRAQQSLFPEKDLNDYFVHARAYFNLTKKDLKLDLGYMDNGADFRSFGAQSKRVDYSLLNNFYNRYTNQQIIRPVSMYDLYNDPMLYNKGITAGIMDYNPVISNVLPYGIATFNRQGGYLGVSYSDKKKIIETNGKFYYLSEVRGQGTTNLRKFMMGQASASLHFENLAGWKKKLVLNAGVCYQNTSRSGEFVFQQVKLNSTTLSAGIEGEIIKKLFLMGNVMMVQGKGNEQSPVRDADGVIINYTPFNVNGMETNISGGIRFDFSEKILFAVLYEYNKNNFVVNNPYEYKQLSILYVMKF